MTTSKKARAFLFLAAVSVYSGHAVSIAGNESAVYADAPAVDAQGAVVAPAPDASAAPTTQNSANWTPPSDLIVVGPRAPAAHIVMADNGTIANLNIAKATDLEDVLRCVAQVTHLNIIPVADAHGIVPAMDLYNVTVPEALSAVLHTNDLDYRQVGNLYYIYSQKQLEALDKQRLTTQVFTLYYTPADNAADMIKPALSADAQVKVSKAAVTGIDTESTEGASSTTGSGGGSTDTGGNSHATQDMIVVNDYPENLEAVAKIIKEIDHRPQQILLEATILQATLSDDNEMGVDFSVLGGVNLSSIAQAPYAAGASAANGSLTNTTGSASSSSSGATTATPGGTTNYTAANTGFTQNVTPGGLQLGIVYDNLAVFVRAIEQVTNTVILANPKVLALDKQEGEVLVGREDGYLTTTVTQTSQTQTVAFNDTGTKLVFRPFIAADGYIRMEIHPEDSTGGTTTQANNVIPFKITTQVTSNVMVKDGNTIVIGGLFRDDTQTSRSQVPLLGNLPYVGALFRSQVDTTTRQEIIILLTPHIIKDDSAYSNLSEDQLKEAEKLRVGVREGMMFFGRERLADTSYEEAVAEMRKPNPDIDKALWHLDCAIDLNPQFVEAVALRERLTGQVVTDPDSSSIRGFVRKAIMDDVAPAAADVLDPSALPGSPNVPSEEQSAAIPSSATTEPSDQRSTASGN